MSNFTTKMRLDHFVEQVRIVSNSDLIKNELVKDAVEVWSNIHEYSEQQESHQIGFLVCEILGVLADHMQDKLVEAEIDLEKAQNRVQDLIEENEELEEESKTLEEKLDDIRHIIDN